MQTVTIDVINNKALKLLQDLELLQLIKLRKEKNTTTFFVDNWSNKYKGSMTKQTLTDIDMQLNQIRKEWE